MADLRTEYNNCLYHAASALHRRLERLAEWHFGNIGHTPTEAFILMTLHDAPGAIISDVARTHQVVPSHITRLLIRMESKGLVLRENMGRVTRVFSTDEGLRMEADARAAWKKLKSHYGKIIGTEEARYQAMKITNSLQKLEDYLA
jgi:MarR family transcriptional regulator, organic hydroperoxide resistance regulator